MDPSQKEDVEILEHGCEDEEYGVLLEEREGLMRPPEVVVLYVEVLLAFPSAIVVAYDFLLRGLPVVCDDASVCVELVGEGDVHVPAVHLRPLDHEAEMRILHECGEREAGYLASLEVYLHGFPFPPAFKLPAVGFAVDGADVERVAVAVHRADDVFREGAAVGAEPVDDHAEVLHEPFKKSLQRILLMEPDVGVPVPVLYAEQQAAETEYAGEIPVGPLVGVLRVMFPRGGELVVEVQVQHAALFEQAQTE